MRIRGRVGSRWEDTVEDRLTYIVVGECWEFSGRRNDSGYGLVTLTRRGVSNARAHRLAYETWVGPIPDGLIIRHTCDNPPCINPAHLIPGTNKCNVADMIERGRDRKHDNVANVLTWDIVDEIRRRRAAGERHVDIAAAVGRSYGAVREATLGVTWPESARPT